MQIRNWKYNILSTKETILTKNVEIFFLNNFHQGSSFNYDLYFEPVDLRYVNIF